MNWHFMEHYPEYTLSAATQQRIEQVYEQIGSGHPRAVSNVRSMLNSRPGAASSLKGMTLMIEVCLRQMLMQLPESPTLTEVIRELLRRPPGHWITSREALLESVYLTKPDMARRHFELLLQGLNIDSLMYRAESGLRTDLRTLINLTPRRALVAGLCEHFLDHRCRQTFLQELLDSFQDLDWLESWSPKWRSQFGTSGKVRQRVLAQVS